ncbi:MAG: hypothetical protein ABW146_16475 [Candidatus Sedimenticola sp. 6PFRAG7]
MKILRIDDNSGYFRFSDKDEWKPIDEIDKDGLMKLLNVYLSKDVEMDNIDEKSLANQAQQIIYKSIFAKLDGLKESKSKFKDESDRTYLTAIEKYSKA